VLVLVPLALVAFGLVMVYDATSAPAALRNGDPMTYLEKQSAYALLGLALMLGASRFDYRRLRLLAQPLVLVSLFLCLAVLVVAAPVNGARRWIVAGPATFQPSELAKLALLVWAASYLSKRAAPMTLQELARPIGALAGIYCVLILAEPDLGTTVAIVVMLAAILLVSGTPPRPLLLAGGAAGLVTLAAVWFEPYRRARIFSFLDPWKDPQGAGFQIVQALIALASGGIFGSGLGNGVIKYNYLPEAHTDMILAVVGEELGLIGITVVVAAYVSLAWAGLNVALRCEDPFGKRLAAGVVALVCGQALINLAAVLGLAPLTGIPLPFISYGGSSLVIALVSVGILLNIAGAHAAAVEVPDRSRRDVRPRRAEPRRGGGVAAARRAGDVRGVAGPRRGAARS
jgi:cell division protein FtsW